MVIGQGSDWGSIVKVPKIVCLHSRYTIQCFEHAMTSWDISSMIKQIRVDPSVFLFIQWILQDGYFSPGYPDVCGNNVLFNYTNIQLSVDNHVLPFYLIVACRDNNIHNNYFACFHCEMCVFDCKSWIDAVSLSWSPQLIVCPKHNDACLLWLNIAQYGFLIL